MWAYNYTDELYHFGVKGMKWGVRKKPEANNKDKKRLSDKQKKVLKFVSVQIAGLAISYAGVKLSVNPKIRGVTGRILDKVGGKKIKKH